MRFLFIKKWKHVPLIAHLPNVSDGVLEIIKVQREPPKARIFQEDQLENSRNQILSQVWMISMKSKWSLWVKVLFLKKNFTEATTQHSRTDARFFVDWSPHVEFYYKRNLWCRCPLNYLWKGYLHDGVVSLMIVNLTRNRPYVLHSFP